MESIVEINSCDYGSTGRIMLQLAHIAQNEEFRCHIVVPNGRHNPWKNKIDYIKFGGRISEDSHIILGAVTGYQGCFSVFSTIRLFGKLQKNKLDIIHLHNLHNSYINLPFLFRIIKDRNIRVIWTLHDCWAFTGRCPHFQMAHCDRWKTGCHDCLYPKHEYPASYVDRTKQMWELKKKWFTGVENMTIVTPSQWLADLVKQSFLKDYPVKVIYNGIDLSVFQPMPSDFREKHGIAADKKLLLGVAFGWGKRKGLDVFCDLAERLDADYQIVLVGTDDATVKQLPESIISIHRTENQRELAEIYAAADVFVNPTREDNFPTTNLESLACGTPVITFKTGGSPEALDETCGSVVPCDDVDALEKEIRRVCTEKPYPREACLERAKAFDMNDRFEEYIKLYQLG